MMLLRAQFTKATRGRWLLAYDRLKNAIVTDESGRVLVDGDSAYHEDIKLIVMMREAVPALLERVDACKENHDLVLLEIERGRTAERQEYDRDVAKLRAELAEVRAELRRASNLAADRGMTIAQAGADTINRDRNHPLVSAVRDFKRWGHRANLLAAYTTWCHTAGVTP